MPIDVKIVKDGIGAEFIGRGELTGQDIIQANNAVHSDEIIQKQKYQLADLTKITSIKISKDDIEKIVQQDKELSILNPDLIIGVAVDKDHVFGLARQWQGFLSSSNITTKVFRTRQEAEQWIDEQLEKF